MNATMSLENVKHQPVMLDQILSIISPQHGGTFIDCTFGGGGYSEAILKYPNTKVLALDRDSSVKKYADDLSKKFPNRFSFSLSKFSDLNKVIKQGLNPRAIIFDLGLSSMQLSDYERGFSFNSKSILGMKMGINNFSAYDAVNILKKDDLSKIIKILGEEKDGRKIANKIMQHRSKKPLKSTDELLKIINISKRNYSKFKKNPATKTFQGLRIFVNQELTELVSGLIAATKILSKGGFLIIVTFHSLEDKIVKYFFNFYSNLKKNPSRYLPVSDTNKNNLFTKISKKPSIPNKNEISKNISSRSAKLRYAIRSGTNFFFPSELKKKFENYLKIEGIKI